MGVAPSAPASPRTTSSRTPAAAAAGRAAGTRGGTVTRTGAPAAARWGARSRSVQTGLARSRSRRRPWHRGPPRPTGAGWAPTAPARPRAGTPGRPARPPPPGPARPAAGSRPPPPTGRRPGPAGPRSGPRPPGPSHEGSSLPPRRVHTRLSTSRQPPAWGLVRERGVGAVTVADIAAATGVSRQLLYVYFENRAGLLVAMARRHDVRSGFAGQAAKAAALPPVEALERLLRLWFGYVPEILPVARALEAAAVNGDEGGGGRGGPEGGPPGRLWGGGGPP